MGVFYHWAMFGKPILNKQGHGFLVQVVPKFLLFLIKKSAFGNMAPTSFRIQPKLQQFGNKQGQVALIRQILQLFCI